LPRSAIRPGREPGQQLPVSPKSQRTRNIYRSLFTALGFWLILALLVVGLLTACVYTGVYWLLHLPESSFPAILGERLGFTGVLLLTQLPAALAGLALVLRGRLRQPLRTLGVALDYARAHRAPIGEVDYTAEDEVGAVIAKYNALVAAFRQQQRQALAPGASNLDQLQTFRDLFHCQRAIMVLFDPDSLAIVEANQAAKAYYGLSHSQCLERTMVDLYHAPPPRDAPPARAEFARGVRGEVLCQIHRRADGAPRPVECLVSAVVNDDGESLNCALIQDIGERLAFQEHLEEQARFLTEAEAITGMGYWFLARDGRMRWSREGYRIHGVDPARFEATPEETLRLVHGEDRERFRSVLQTALRSGETFTLEVRVRHPGDEWRLIQYQGRALNPGEDPQRRGVLAVFRDITERRELEQRLREQERIQDQAARLARLGSFVWDLGAERYRYCSREMAAIFGDTQARFIQAIHSEQALIERIHPDDQLGYLRKRDEAAREQRPYEVEFRIRDPASPEWRQLIEMGEVVSDEAGRALRLVGSTQDISRLKAMEDKLRQETSFRSQAAKLAMLGTFVWDLGEDRCFFCSGELATIYGLTTPEEYTQQFDAMPALLAQIHPDDRERYLNARQQARAEGEHYQIEYRLINVLGRECYVAEIAQVLSYGGGRLRVVGSVQDISDKKRREQELQRLATTDELTGVFNRRHFMTLAGKAFMQAKRREQPLSVLMLDIDHFKSINTRFEHAGGDAALQAFTRSCQSALRPQDALGRLGGEEFAVLLPEADAAGAYQIAERIRHHVSKLVVQAPAGSREPRFGMTVSIGLAAASASDTSIDQTLLRADSALFSAKDGGRNRVHPVTANPARQRH